MYQRMIFAIAKFFYFFNVRGSTRLLLIIFKFLPFKRVEAKHPLGFTWFLDSKESLSIFLSSCERFTTKLISDLGKDLNFVVCVGANRGWYPLLLNKVHPNIEIHAYEPNSRTFAMLERNVELNHASVTLHRIGLGFNPGVSDFFGYLDANDGMATLYPTNCFATKYEKIEQIAIRTLDSEALTWNVPKGLSLIQMDIEGGEYEALLGSKNFLEKYSPIVICEVNPVLLGSAKRLPSELFAYMEQLGYLIYWINERGGLYSQNSKDPCRHLPFLPTGSGSNYIFVKDFHRSKISSKIKD